MCINVEIINSVPVCIQANTAVAPQSRLAFELC